MIMAYRVVVNDIVSGIIGMFYSKEEAPGRERRYVIKYKPPTMLGVMGKPQALPSTVPPEGMIEIPGTQCADGYPRLIVFSYGRDDLYPPLVPSLAQKRIGDTIKKLDELSVSTETKQEALEARERILDRSREKIVKDSVKLGQEISQSAKKRSGGFISMDVDED